MGQAGDYSTLAVPASVIGESSSSVNGTIWIQLRLVSVVNITEIRTINVLTDDASIKVQIVPFQNATISSGNVSTTFTSTT
jgi:hypothetical protein